jgi:hypothetical protein
MHHIQRVHDARRRRPQKPTLNSLRNPTESVSSAPRHQPTFKETIMSKLSTFAAYPAIAAIALASAFSAQAQSMNDPADQAAYGAMPAATSTNTAALRNAKTSLFAGVTAHGTTATDVTDQAAYGAMPAASLSLRTRAEVRAEAIAARDAGFDANYSESGDPQHAALARAKPVDGPQMVASASVKSAK